MSHAKHFLATNSTRVFDQPATRDNFLPHEFQLHVFVSPFVEPAHVHIGSIVEYRFEGREDTVFGTRVVYNAGAVESWFFRKLEERLGVAGQAIPADPDHEVALSARLLGDNVDACTKTHDEIRGGYEGKLKPPKKLFHIQPLYPGNAKHEWREALVVMEVLILRDGSAVNIETKSITVADEEGSATALKFPDRSEVFRYAAEGAVSLWRYKPVFLRDCPVHCVMTVTVDFFLK